MRHDLRKYLWDARRAADLVIEFIADADRAGYRDNLLLCSAVERQFEIVGEALHQVVAAGSGARPAYSGSVSHRRLPEQADPRVLRDRPRCRLEHRDHRPASALRERLDELLTED